MTGADISLPNAEDWGHRILERLEQLALHGEAGPGVTRRFATQEHLAVHGLLSDWMVDAGMTVHMDAAGNTIGRYEGKLAGAPALMIGSHQDTVRQGGRYDGILGVVIPIACVQQLRQTGESLPFAVEVVAFGDEEGLRFGTGLFGSSAMIGKPHLEDLERKDEDGTTLAQALRNFGLDPEAIPTAVRKVEELLAFVEVHIEQGPVLEAENLPVGIVTAITHGANLIITFTGTAGHAGTVPMERRQDALAAAAEAIQAVETLCRGTGDLVGTVGQLTLEPGATNVIPGSCRLAVDIRSPDEVILEAGIAELQRRFEALTRRRGVAMTSERRYNLPGCACTPWLMAQIEAAVVAEGIAPRRLFSGAGHDTMAMRHIADIAMLFVRCSGGISHNPAEAITAVDAGIAARVLTRFIRAFDPKQGAAM